jgi:hypothetical protein
VLTLHLPSQFAVLLLEVEDHADAGEVQSGVQQVTDTAQPFEIVSAVAAGSAIGAFGLEQPTGLVGRRFCTPMPTSSAATEMPYTPC